MGYTENIAIIRGLGGVVAEGACISTNEAILCAEIQRLSKPWPIRGVRVEGDKVIVTVKGGNDAARKLCGEILDTKAKAG